MTKVKRVTESEEVLLDFLRVEGKRGSIVTLLEKYICKEKGTSDGEVLKELQTILQTETDRGFAAMHKKGYITEEQEVVIRKCIETKGSMVITSKPKAGKSTIMKCILEEYRDVVMVVVEDSHMLRGLARKETGVGIVAMSDVGGAVTEVLNRKENGEDVILVCEFVPSDSFGLVKMLMKSGMTVIAGLQRGMTEDTAGVAKRLHIAEPRGGHEIELTEIMLKDRVNCSPIGVHKIMSYRI